MQFNIRVNKADQTFGLDYDKLSDSVKAHILEYGVRQLLNDAAASAKTADEAKGMVEKRIKNLQDGVLRASPNREGDPVRARALQLALKAIQQAPGFKAWLTENKLKVGDKDAVAKLRELSVKQVDKEGNQFTAQAEKDIAAQKRMMAGMELDLDL